MVNARMLKELQNLAPWTWDKKCEMHPPGSKALHDFERVEHYQRNKWSKPPAARPRKPSKKKAEAAGPASAAVIDVQQPFEASEEETTVWGDKAPSSPPSSSPSSSIPPTPMSAVTSSATAGSTPLPSDVSLSVSHSSYTAITPAAVSMVTPLTVKASVERPFKASVMPRRLSLDDSQHGNKSIEKPSQGETASSKTKCAAQGTVPTVLSETQAPAASPNEPVSRDVELKEASICTPKSVVSAEEGDKPGKPAAAVEAFRETSVDEPDDNCKGKNAQATATLPVDEAAKPATLAAEPSPNAAPHSSDPALHAKVAKLETLLGDREACGEVDFQATRKSHKKPINVADFQDATTPPSIPAPQLCKSKAGSIRHHTDAVTPKVAELDSSVESAEPRGEVHAKGVAKQLLQPASAATAPVQAAVESAVPPSKSPASVETASKAAKKVTTAEGSELRSQSSAKQVAKTVQQPVDALPAAVQVAARPAMPSSKSAVTDAVASKVVKRAATADSTEPCSKVEVKEVVKTSSQLSVAAATATTVPRGARQGGPASQPFKVPRRCEEALSKVAPPAASVAEMGVSESVPITCGERDHSKVCTGRVKAESHVQRKSDGSGKVWAAKAPRSTTARKPLATLKTPPGPPNLPMSSLARQSKRSPNNGMDENAPPKAKKPRVLLVPATKTANVIGDINPASCVTPAPQLARPAAPEKVTVAGQGILQALAAQEEGGSAAAVVQKFRPISILPAGRQQDALMGSRKAAMAHPHAGLLAALTPTKCGQGAGVEGARRWAFGATMSGAFSILRKMDSRSGWKY